MKRISCYINGGKLANSTSYIKSGHFFLFLGAEMQTDVGCLCLAIDVFATALCYLGHKLESVTC